MPDPGLGSAPRPRLSLGPALIVIVIVVVVVGGGVALALSGRRPGATVSGGTAAASSLVVGSGPAAVTFSRGAGLLRSLTIHAIVPTDVRAALVAPTGARRTGTQNHDRGQGPFDRSVTLECRVVPAALAHAYRVVLRRLGWHINAVGPVEERGAPATQILAEIASVDGYYWQVGVTIGRPRPSTSGSAPVASATTLRLLEVLDAA